jgi:hypothetical protein
MIPNNPRTSLNIKPFAIAITITIATSNIKEEKLLWIKYITINRALKQQILKAVRDNYTSSLRHHMTGYANICICSIIDHHLLRTYGHILPLQLQENNQQFRMVYNPNKPIEQLAVQTT